MTVPVQTPVTSTEANGVTTVFPYGFKITDADDLRVSVNDVVVTSGFSISGVGNDAGGSVTFSVAPSNHSIVVCELDSQLKRESDFQQFGDWIAEVINNEFDRIWLALQSLKQFMSRAVMIRLSSILEDFNSELPPPVAGAVIGWNSSKNGFVNVSPEYVTSLVDANGNVTFPYGLGFSGHAMWADWSTSVGMYGSGNYFQRLVGAKTSVCTIPPLSGPGPTYESEFVAFGGLPLPVVMDVPYIAMRADGNAGAPMRTVSGRSGSLAPYRAYAINTYGSDKLVIEANAEGTYTFNGTAPRIRGDFSNAASSARLGFQTNTANASTTVEATPNGTGVFSSYKVNNSSNPDNASYGQLSASATSVSLTSGKTGAGSYLPLVLNVGGVDVTTIATTGEFSVGSTATIGKMNVVQTVVTKPALYTQTAFPGVTAGDTVQMASFADVRSANGDGIKLWGVRDTTTGVQNDWTTISYEVGRSVDATHQSSLKFSPSKCALRAGGLDTLHVTSTNTLHVNPTGGLGYGTGAGGAVTQTTSRTTTTPSINKPNGDITLFTAAGSATDATFTVPNNLVGIYDDIRITTRGGTNKYLAQVTNIVANTSFDVTFRTTGGTASDTPIFHFTIGKGSNA